MVGLGAGLLFARVNRTLTRGGGIMARVRMGRAALVAMIASLSVPITIGIGENGGLGWQLAFVVAAILILAGPWTSRRRRWVIAKTATATGRLPSRYRLAWWLVVLVVSVEFSMVRAECRARRAGRLPRRSGHGFPVPTRHQCHARPGAGVAESRVGAADPRIRGSHPRVTLRAGLGRRCHRRLDRMAARTGALPGRPGSDRPSQPGSARMICPSESIRRTGGTGPVWTMRPWMVSPLVRPNVSGDVSRRRCRRRG